MKNKKIWNILFIVYIIILFLLVVIKFYGNINDLFDRVKSISELRKVGVWNYNMVPIVNMRWNLRHVMTDSVAFMNILGNIIPFIPLGFLLPIVFSKLKGFIIVVIFCIIIMFIEVFQFITLLGYLDIDDFILNMSGCILGYIIFLFWSVIYKKRPVFS